MATGTPSKRVRLAYILKRRIEDDQKGVRQFRGDPTYQKVLRSEIRANKKKLKKLGKKTQRAANRVFDSDEGLRYKGYRRK